WAARTGETVMMATRPAARNMGVSGMAGSAAIIHRMRPGASPPAAPGNGKARGRPSPGFAACLGALLLLFGQDRLDLGLQVAEVGGRGGVLRLGLGRGQVLLQLGQRDPGHRPQFVGAATATESTAATRSRNRTAAVGRLRRGELVLQ